MNQSNPLCIAGMHRSGTSLVAGWMYNSGYFLGNSLLEAASSNPKGHFEDEDILNFHSEILERVGFHRSGLTIDHNNFQFNSKDLETAERLVHERIQHDLWVWKEPRTTLFLKSWKKLIPNLKVVGIFRKPEMVIDSLYKRLKRNKWYYTRNPLKKLKWYIDIDLNQKKWNKIFSQSYTLYNENLLQFQKEWPQDILIFDIETVISQPKSFEIKIKSFINSNVNLIPFDDFFEEKYINSKGENFEGIPEKEASLIYDKLKSLSKTMYA